MGLTATDAPSKSPKQLRHENTTAEASARDAVRRKREAEATVSRLMNILRNDGIDLPSTTADERVGAQIDLPAARDVLVRAQRDELRAQEQAAATRLALKLAEDGEVEAEAAAICGRLLKGLHALRPDADKLAELLQASSTLRVGALQFTFAQSSSSQWTAPLDQLEAAWRSAGLLDSLDK